MDIGRFISDSSLQNALQRIESERSILAKSFFEDGNYHNDHLSSHISEIEKEVSCFFDKVIVRIKDFFGDADVHENINNIYKGLMNPNNKDICVVSNDFIKSYYEYEEYLNGFADFVKLIFGIKENEVNEGALSERLEKVSNNDTIFIEELFRSKDDENECILISDAMKNIEFIIDLMDELPKIKEELLEIIGGISSIIDVTAQESVNLLMFKIRAILLYTRSRMIFVDKLINENFKLFVEIISALNTPERHPHLNTNNDDTESVVYPEEEPMKIL